MKPSQFYKEIRPEYFSDSEIIDEFLLPNKEVLKYELSQISTNQKQDNFETLCRRMAEKFITPNLIPQVGPTGGGDGKTDFETYPVSSTISDRWFIPENGWKTGEEWAFAISAKKNWKTKAKEDIKKIVGINRGYTRVYFITNQWISSKKRKDAQDEFKKEFNIEIIIFDGEWIIEHIYSNDIADIVANSLNLSNIYKPRKHLGANDSFRLKQLKKLEQNILNPNRYSSYDFQLVEDALEAAILSRMLEKPRDEVEGKFYMVFRFCKKINNLTQWIKFYYQRAWTYLYWYDDYCSFIEDYKKFKEYILQNINIYNIELYFSLFFSLRGLDLNKVCNLTDYNIDIEKEKTEIINILSKFGNNLKKPHLALISNTYKTLLELIYSQSPSNCFKKLSDILSQCQSLLDYPFEGIKEIIERLGSIFPNNTEYDKLIDNLVKISEKRYSELAASNIFIKIGYQKLCAKYYKKSIVYFGKAIMKLAKKESKDTMCLVLLALGMAYRELGLIWAANNCYISACYFSFPSRLEKKKLNERLYQSIEEIIKNELFIGRFPSLFTWYEMLSILNRSSNEKFSLLTDSCLSVRILLDTAHTEEFQYLPDLLKKLELYISYDATLYKLGYIDEIIKNYKYNNEQDLNEFYKKFTEQPFTKQMLYQNNFMSENELRLSSNIIGCKFLIKFSKNIENLLLAETLLAYLEGFFATSIGEIFPHTETVNINIKSVNGIPTLKFTYSELEKEYNIFVNNITEKSKNFIGEFMLKFTFNILEKHFKTKNPKNFISNLFEEEKITERLFLIIDHRNFIINLFGETPKLFFDDWKNYTKPKKYISKRKTPILYNQKISNSYNQSIKKKDINKIRHDEIKIESIIDISLWNKANWKGFGFSFHPQEGLGILLCYENADAGKKIFDQWINKFGKEDKSDLIRIAIIKGINKNNPYWYKVHISKNIEFKTPLKSDMFFATSRIHEMTPDSPENLNNLIGIFNTIKKYKLCPAKMSHNGSIEPFVDKSILKTTLIIKDIQEIEENDLDIVALGKNDIS